MMFDLNTIAYSAFVGVIYAGLGYAKKHKVEDFNPAKFLRTVGVGVLVGIIAPYTGLDLAAFDFESAATAGGLIFFLQTILQIVFEKRDRRR